MSFPTLESSGPRSVPSHRERGTHCRRCSPTGRNPHPTPLPGGTKDRETRTPRRGVNMNDRRGTPEPDPEGRPPLPPHLRPNGPGGSHPSPSLPYTGSDPHRPLSCRSTPKKNPGSIYTRLDLRGERVGGRVCDPGKK